MWNPGSGWEYGGTHESAVWVTAFNGRRALEDKTTRTQYHVAVVIEGLMVVVVYLQPSQTLRELHEELDALESLRLEWRGPILFCGDFNAKSPAWGSRTLERRGGLIMEFMARMNLHPLMALGGTHTFMSGRGRTSTVDFAFCDSSTMRMVTSSQILSNIETRSDHLYVLHTLCTPESVKLLPLYRWEPKSLEIERMKAAYDAYAEELPLDRE